MASTLPSVSPQNILLELEQFKAKFNTFVKNQYEWAENEKKWHNEQCQNYKDTMSTLKQREKEAKQSLDYWTKETEKKKHELHQLESNHAKLLESEKILPGQVQEYKDRVRTLELKLVDKRAELCKKKRIQKIKMDDATNQCSIFEKLLGLKIEVLEVGKVCFIFTNIDKKNFNREFRVTIIVTEDLKIKVAECKPSLENITGLEMRDFSSLMLLRRKFKASI